MTQIRWIIIDPQERFSESQLNEKLGQWGARFGVNFGLDHVTLRRYLIDEGYLQRDAAGTFYQLAPSRTYTFEPALVSLDLDELIASAEREREERKKKFMKKT